MKKGLIFLKKNTQDALGLMAYVSLLVFTAFFILSKIGANVAFFAWLGNGLLLVVVLVLAKSYIEKLSTVWRVIYYLIAIFAIVAFIWGFF